MWNWIASHHVIEVFIVLWAVGVGVLFYFTLKKSIELHNDLAPRDRIANPSEKRKRPMTREDRIRYENMILKKRERMNLFYSLYANCTSALPLWGMLGTVVSLIALAGNMGQEELAVDRFFTALYTTAFGIFFAILFKSLDSFIAVKVSDNNKEADTLLERNTDLKLEQAKKYQEEARHEAP